MRTMLATCIFSLGTFTNKIHTDGYQSKRGIPEALLPTRSRSNDFEFLYIHPLFTAPRRHVHQPVLEAS